MKLKLFALVILGAIFFTNTADAQADHMAKDKMMKKEKMMDKADKMMDKHMSANKIVLEQVAGDFTVKGLTLSAGTYQFEITNNGVDHELGFVLVPAGKSDPSDHIKEAYVTAPVANGQSSLTKEVTLSAGTYEYFCPLNPTPKYTITVK